MKYFFDFKEEYSDVGKVKPRGNNFKIGNIYFGYMPDGFKYEILKEGNSQTVIDFSNGDKYFMFKISESKWGRQVNTENAKVEEMVINNKDMVYYENETEKYLTWQENNKVCLLSTNCEKEILLDVAEAINLNEETSPQN